VTIQGNSGDSCGGGIYSNGNLSLTNCAVIGNKTGNYSGGGGGIASGNRSGFITIVNSSISNNTSGGGGPGGGMIVNAPNVSLINSTVANNQVGGGGGGISCYMSGAFTMTGCTISGNTALNYGGGGLYLYSRSPTGTVSISNSTFVNNTASNYRGIGGGIRLVNLANTNAVTIKSSTITGNSAAETGTNAGYGGGGIGVSFGAGSIRLDNTIVSGNRAANGRPDIAVLDGVTVTTAYSAVGNTTGFTYIPGRGDLPVGTNLNLQPLANNGGPTPTVAIDYDSPAFDAGDPALNGTTDQRGVSRPQQVTPVNAPDIGAYERVHRQDVVATAASVNSAGGTTYTFTVAFSDPLPINPATFASGNVTVNGTLTAGGAVTPAVTFVGADTSNPNSVVATYQFTPPGGSWSHADDGAYTISLQPNQVSDANGYFPPGPIGFFQVLARQPYMVTNTNDSGPGSLRAAIVGADADAPFADSIGFSNSTAGGATNFYDGVQHTIALLTALPALTNPVLMTGPGSFLLTVQRSAAATSAFQIFSINGTGTQAVALSGLTITGGSAATGAGIQDSAQTLTLTDVTVANNTSSFYGAGIDTNGGGTLNVSDSSVINNHSAFTGGGIYGSANEIVNITNSTVSNNTAASAGGVAVTAGGILTVMNSTMTGNQGSSGGAIEITGTGSIGAITNSTIANNSATTGGAVDCANSGNLAVIASTLSGNTAAASGGAIYFSGASVVTITNSTLVNNTVGSNGGAVLLIAFGGTANLTGSTITGNAAGAGGGIAFLSGAGTLHLDDTIVSGNSALNANSDIAAPSQATVTTTYSAIGNTTGFTYAPGPGDLPVGANLYLQPLANNGGPTQTIAFAAGSPLLNAGDPMTALTTDQRGVPRTIGPAPDIGAYEYQPITVANIQVNDGSAQRSEVRSITVTFSGPVSFTGGNAAAAFQLQHVQDATIVNNLAAAVSTNGSGQTVVTLTFTTTGNAATEIDPVSARNGGAASLADGRYSLTVLGSAVTDAAFGWNLDGDADGTPGGNYFNPADTLGGGPGQLRLYRIFADTNGDGVVDQQDLGQFRATLNAGSGNPLYLSILDADNSGVVDQIDLGQFRGRFNAGVF
jgi:hypothetical protein